MSCRTTLLLVAISFFSSISMAQVPVNPGLKDRVLKDLRDYYGGGAEFDIEVNKAQEVRIQGSAASYWDKRNVQTIVSRVRGVVAIKNHLVVRTKFVANETLRANIETHLRDNMAISEPERIRVHVDSGRVTLRGDVNFAREAYIAEDVASWRKGVIDVVNELKVLPHEAGVSDNRLAEIINSTITRFFAQPGNSITVRVQNGQVTLSGTVDSLWSKRQISKEVRKFQGVKRVDNQLRVALVTSRK